MMEAIVTRSGAQAASGRSSGCTNRSATVAVDPENIASISGKPLR
jgi:hypothetical protein